MRLNLKASRTGRQVYMQTMGAPQWTPREYDRLAKESYERNAISFRCTKLVAEAVASMPLLVYEGQEELDTHPFLDLINNPNPHSSRHSLIIQLVSFLLLAGNSYLEVVRLDGRLRELHVLRPDRMRIVPGARGYPESYEYVVNGSRPTVFRMPVTGQHPLLHLKNFHPTEDFYGLSAIEAAALSIDIHNSSSAFNKALLDNGARPTGALVYNGGEEGNENLTDEQFYRLKAELEEQFQGPKNAGRPLLLDGGLDWKEMGTAPRDLEYTDARDQSARDIALALGVPSQLLGIPGDNTYTNYSQAVRAFYRQTVIPTTYHIAQELTVFLRPTYGPDFRIGTDLDSVEALAEERESLWTRVSNADFLTVDEKRLATGYDPHPDPSVGSSMGDNNPEKVSEIE